MENILDVYAKPYNKNYPVICFDERPCQLIGNIVSPVLPSEKRIAKEDYHYERNGTCSVLLAIEPLTGKRFVEVSKTRKKIDYAKFMEKVVNTWKDAKEINLVQDNLNTHKPSSFYRTFNPEKSFKLMRKINMIYTPRKASWLNMAEIEFSALSKQCLNRRIPDIEKLKNEVMIWTKNRIQKKIKINWQFNLLKARKTLSRHYNKIRKD